MDFPVGTRPDEDEGWEYDAGDEGDPDGDGAVAAGAGIGDAGFSYEPRDPRIREMTTHLYRLRDKLREAADRCHQMAEMCITVDRLQTQGAEALPQLLQFTGLLDDETARMMAVISGLMGGLHENGDDREDDREDDRGDDNDCFTR